jgi:hypothetical protein
MNPYDSTALEDLIRQGATPAKIRAELGKRGVRQCPVCGSLFRMRCNTCAAREYRATHHLRRPSIEPRRFASYLYVEDGAIGVEVVDTENRDRRLT